MCFRITEELGHDECILMLLVKYSKKKKYDMNKALTGTTKVSQTIKTILHAYYLFTRGDPEVIGLLLQF